MLNEYFLFSAGLIILIVGSIIDLRKREIPDSLNFTGLWAVLIFKIIVSFTFFLQGLFGALIFLLVSSLFVRGGIFGGGDAKLLMFLGAIITFSNSMVQNIGALILFAFIFFFVSIIYLFIARVILKKKKLAFGPSILITFLLFIHVVLSGHLDFLVF